MKTQMYQKNTEAIVLNVSDGNDLKQGNILIPDISGFTQFVNEVDMVTGQYIISRLLNVLLESNVLRLKVSEIEGDAILFYKLGIRFTRKEVLNQYKVMQDNFSEELLILSEESGLVLNLGLKLIAHYGPLTEYKIGGFTKLYGKSVIEAHRLLKNTVNSDQYIIMTDDLLNAPAAHNEHKFGIRICEQYNHLEHICFTWLGLNSALCQNVHLPLY